MARLEKEGWLDDVGAARSLVRARRDRYGRSRIERELAVRGFSAAAARQALEELPREREESALARAFARLWRSFSSADRRRRRERVARALVRRGFPVEKVFEMMKSFDAID